MLNLYYSFSYCLIGHFCVSLGQYFKYLGKLFSAILYAYYGVCSILVPWSTMCYASEMGGNLFRHYFDSTVTNTLKLRVNSSGPCFFTYGTMWYHKEFHFHQLEHVLQPIQYFIMCSSRNMAVTHGTEWIWLFWLDIQILLKKWVQMIYRCVHFMPLLSNPNLGLEHWNSHSKGYRPDIEIPSSYLGSPHQIGPDDI